MAFFSAEPSNIPAPLDARLEAHSELTLCAAGEVVAIFA
tara:strand:- start:195 stop:311 length:117 start_codon:yes stop_codon:yes gene_type:complete